MIKNLNIIEIADNLHREADRIIYDSGIDKILNTYGNVFYTGSYFLNVMVWQDLDITIVMKPDPYSIEAFFEIGRKIARIDFVTSLRFDNFYKRKVQNLPEGLYWGIRFDSGNQNKPWKIDLWAKDKQSFAQDRTNMESILQKMDQETRKLIIETKHSLLTPEGRTLELSGYQIYKAILFEGLRCRDDVVSYLKAHDIKV